MGQELLIQNIKSGKELGVALRRLRKSKGLTQLEVAEKLNLRQATVSDIERGKGTLESLFKIIRALPVNMALSNDVVRGKEDKTSKTSKMIDLMERS